MTWNPRNSDTCTPLEFLPAKPGVLATVIKAYTNGYEHRPMRVMGWVRTWRPFGDMPLLEGWDGDWDGTLIGNDELPWMCGARLVLIPAADGDGFLDHQGNRWGSIAQAGRSTVEKLQEMKAANVNAPALDKPGSWHGHDRRRHSDRRDPSHVTEHDGSMMAPYRWHSVANRYASRVRVPGVPNP